MPVNPLVKFIRGAEANKPNPVDGQILFTTDTYKLYIDDATTHHLINPDIPAAGSNTPSAVAQTAAVGSSSNFARADHVHNIVVGTGDANGQVKIAGQNANVKGLGTAAYKGMASSIVSTDTGVPTAAQVANAISTATSGLTSAMHFAGTSTTAITDGGTENPTISGYTTKTAGDIVLYNGKEFVWTGSAWEELGDEGSYALKTIQIIAGTGLSGGGTLEANRTLNLVAATANTLGGIALGFTQDGKNYPIVLDASNKAYVNIPWTDTTYTFAEGTTNGAFSVTPVGGTAQSVSVHGLATAAYKSVSSTGSSDTSGLVTENKVTDMIAAQALTWTEF